MQKVFSNLFTEFFYDSSSEILFFNWLDTEQLEEESFREILLKQAENVEKFKPKGLLIDTVRFVYTISLETQDWVNNEIMTRFFAAGLRRMALTISTELIAQLSIEQTLEEETSQQFQISYFDDNRKGVDWLRKSEKVLQNI